VELLRETVDAPPKLLPKFLNLTFISWQQAPFFSPEKKKSANCKNIAMQLDFAENYTV